jgi:hypothetical protein
VRFFSHCLCSALSLHYHRSLQLLPPSMFKFHTHPHNDSVWSLPSPAAQIRIASLLMILAQTFMLGQEAEINAAPSYRGSECGSYACLCPCFLKSTPRERPRGDAVSCGDRDGNVLMEGSKVRLSMPDLHRPVCSSAHFPFSYLR